MRSLEPVAYVPGEKCPLVGHVISWTSDEWIDGAGICHGCGGRTRLKVRATDRPPWAKALTHNVPRDRMPK